MPACEQLFSEKTLGQFFDDLLQTQPERPFIIYADRGLVWTYQEFYERCERMAKGLLAIGVGKGDHVGVWARNVPEWLTLLFATAKIGAVLVTINTNYKKHELEYVLRQSDMHTLAIVDGQRDVSYVDIVYELIPELREAPRGLSALNILRGEIAELRPGQGPGMLVVLAMGEERLLARLTRRSVEALGLEPGQSCHAIMKSVAVAPEDVGGAAAAEGR